MVKHLMETLDAEFAYSHKRNKKLIQDLNINHKDENFLENYLNCRFLESEDTLYVNTWIGGYIPSNAGKHTIEIDDATTRPIINPVYDDKGIFLGWDAHWLTYYSCWQHIYSTINKKFNTNLKLLNVIDYIPEINYSLYDTSSIDFFIDCINSDNIVIISNNLVSSEQSYTNDNLQGVINRIAISFPNITFVLTNKIETNCRNIFFTDDIIVPRDGCDLNEISYLSTLPQVRAIIGRSSGPFNFMNVKQNLMNPKKKILGFGKMSRDFLPFNLPIKCQFNLFQDYSDEIVMKQFQCFLETL